MTVHLYQFQECHESGLVRRRLREARIPFEAITLPTGDKTLLNEKFNSNSVPYVMDGAFRSDDLGAILAHVARKAA